MHCNMTRRVAALAGGLVLLLAAAQAGAFTVSSRAEGEALVSEHAENPGAYMAYATFLVDCGRTADATGVLELGRERAEPSGELLVALARLYRDRELWVKAETAASAALALDPADPEALVVLGEVYFALGWSRAGLDSFREAVAADPTADLPRVRLVGGLLDAGLGTEAEDQCLRFISEDPENPELWMALGRVFEHQGKRREAFTTYGQVLSLDSTVARAFARQGKLFCEFGQFQAAEQSCRQALALDEDDALAHAYLGIALSRVGDADEARRHAEIAEAAGLNMTSVWRTLDK